MPPLTSLPTALLVLRAGGRVGSPTNEKLKADKPHFIIFPDGLCQTTRGVSHRDLPGVEGFAQRRQVQKNHYPQKGVT